MGDKCSAAALGRRVRFDMDVRPRCFVSWCLIAFLLFSMGSLAVIAGTARTAKASSYTVINVNDSGAGSLREAIGFANGETSDTDINFDEGAMGGNTITLTSGPLDVGNPGGYKITIDGESTPSGFIDIKNGGGPSDCFNLIDGNNELHGFKISGFTGAIDITCNRNYIRHCCLVGNVAEGIAIDGSQDNTIDSCYIGYDFFTSTPNGNGVDGIKMQSGAFNNTVGSNPSEPCVIGWNGENGVDISELAGKNWTGA